MFRNTPLKAKCITEYIRLPEEFLAADCYKACVNRANGSLMVHVIHIIHLLCDFCNSYFSLSKKA